MAGNSPDLGAKILVITDNDKNYGNNLSFELGMKLFKLRKKFNKKATFWSRFKFVIFGKK